MRAAESASLASSPPAMAAKLPPALATSTSALNSWYLSTSSGACRLFISYSQALVSIDSCASPAELILSFAYYFIKYSMNCYPQDYRMLARNCTGYTCPTPRVYCRIFAMRLAANSLVAVLVDLRLQMLSWSALSFMKVLRRAIRTEARLRLITLTTSSLILVKSRSARSRPLHHSPTNSEQSDFRARYCWQQSESAGKNAGQSSVLRLRLGIRFSEDFTMCSSHQPNQENRVLKIQRQLSSTLATRDISLFLRRASLVQTNTLFIDSLSAFAWNLFILAESYSALGLVFRLPRRNQSSYDFSLTVSVILLTIIASHFWYTACSLLSYSFTKGQKECDMCHSAGQSSIRPSLSCLANSQKSHLVWLTSSSRFCSHILSSLQPSIHNANDGFSTWFNTQLRLLCIRDDAYSPNSRLHLSRSLWLERPDLRPVSSVWTESLTDCQKLYFAMQRTLNQPTSSLKYQTAKVSYRPNFRPSSYICFSLPAEVPPRASLNSSRTAFDTYSLIALMPRRAL